MTKQTSVPKLRFPEFSEELNSIKLSKEIDNLGYGPRFNSNDYNLTGNVKTIRGTDIGLNGEIKYSQVPLALLEEKLIQNHILEDGDLVMITTADCGLTGVFRSQEVNYIASAYAVKIKLKASSSPFFFKYYFQTELSKNQVNKFIRKATVANLPGSDVLNFKVSIPPLPEQTKIANFLTAIDEKIQGLKKKKSFLEEYKKGLMQQIFSQKLRFKQDDGSDFPDWEEKGGNIIFESISNRNHNSDLPILAITQEFGAVPRESIDYSVSVTEKSVESYKVVEVGDFIISLRSFQGGIEYSNFKGICSPAYVILRPIVSLDNRFFKFYFKTETYIKLLNKNLEGIRDGKMISFKYFSEIQLPIPSLLEQEKIAYCLSSIDEKIEKVSRQIAEVELYKKGLLQQMFV